MSPTEYTRVNDLVGCFLDIRDALESEDLEYANRKLYTYFGHKDIFAGNVIDEGYDIYLSSYDKEQGAVEYYLEKAIEDVYETY